ncbi:MAG TPA: hypothetical protein VFN09_04845 [Rhodanobacteraceae bacterium]|nr:hypothetical protein [Rhodanobacteraceae bacterium]
MLLWIMAGFFFWLALRELRAGLFGRTGYAGRAAIDLPYIGLMLALGTVFAYPALERARLEHILLQKARILAGTNKVSVHCNTLFDSFLDRNVFAAGHANEATGAIVFQHPWCSRLIDYLHHPASANRDELISFAIFVHESMHIRGEWHDEARTECQAIQRLYRAGTLLGVPAAVAKRNGRAYYRDIYQQRATQGWMSAGYYSPECAPGKALDEHLPDATWNDDSTATPATDAPAR